MSLSLLFHDVVDAGAESGFQGADADIYKLSRTQFDGALEAIERHRMDVTLGVSARAQRALVLTFDDGGASAMHVADTLERKEWRGMFFIPSAYLGRRGFVSAREVQELHSRGHIVGSHSHTHPIPITALPVAQIREEWQRSTGVLGDAIGVAVDRASVPAGFYSSTVAESAAEAGIKALFTSEPRSDSWTLADVQVHGRFCIMRGTSSRHLEALLRGSHGVLLRERALWEAKKLLKRAGGGSWLAARRLILSQRAGIQGDRRSDA